MISLIYVLIILVATTLGACAGIGGGIIIKPLFDLFNEDNVQTISLLSAIAVFSMSVLSIIKNSKSIRHFKLSIILLIALSSIVGGYLGNIYFNHLLIIIGSTKLKLIQSLSMCAIVIFLVIYFIKNFKSFNLLNNFLIIFTGIILGFISSFLSIGGGPLNIAIYTWILGFTIKESVLYSIATIFFAQGTQLLSIAITHNLVNYNLTRVPYIICAAIVGALVGSYIYKKLNDKSIRAILTTVMILVLAINVYNTFGVL